MRFQTDSPVFQFLGTLSDFVILNLVFIITCIPIITIGPAVSALLNITMRESRKEGGYMIRPYLKAMKENFLKSLLLSLLYSAAAVVLIFNLAFWLQIDTLAGSIALLLVTLCSLLYLISLIYVFALSTRFQNSICQSIKNSLFLALNHPKQTVLIVIIFGLALLLCYTTALFRALMAIFGFSFLAYCAAFPLTAVFSQYENENEKETEKQNSIA